MNMYVGNCVAQHLPLPREKLTWSMFRILWRHVNAIVPRSGVDVKALALGDMKRPHVLRVNVVTFALRPKAHNK